VLTPPRSLWWSTLDQPVVPRAAFQGHRDVDVAIVGGGFTGLWTARELLRRDPSLRIAIFEKSVCGFGASGRNGGWASALYPISDEKVEKSYGSEALRHQRELLRTAVDTLGRCLSEDGIDADFVKGGTLTFARSDMQRTRLESATQRSDDVWLSPNELSSFGSVAGALGASYSAHCARIHPGKMVRGLSTVVEKLGATIYEESEVLRIIPKGRQAAQVVTVSGSVHATYVVRATEGFTSTLPSLRRAVAPVYSLMIASAPQSDSFWDAHGFSQFPTFTDDRNLIIYGQRTADNRIAFGGRGAPYHFGSTVEERFDQNEKVFAELERTLRELFPDVENPRKFQWGGPLGMTRDLSPFVRVDHSTGLCSAGGYTGDGVVLSHVAATALADLIVTPDQETDFTKLTFVHHRSRSWEPEPLRWLGINAGLALAQWADRTERRKNKSSKASVLLEKLLG